MLGKIPYQDKTGYYYIQVEANNKKHAKEKAKIGTSARVISAEKL